MNATQAVAAARRNASAIPAFNVPYLPMLAPIVEAVADEDAIAMVQVARVEWEKFGAVSIEAVAAEYLRFKNDRHTLLHMDHIPVVDEDQQAVDYMALIERAIAAGYQSVMVDASRLNLRDNIDATRSVVEVAHRAGLPCEAELGAVMGHESGPRMPYEEIFQSKKGFTDLEEARTFVAQSGCDWLSVACGNIHGAVAESTRHEKKPTARLDIAHIEALSDATNCPLVLHGGSGIDPTYIRQAIRAGIAKINVGTEIRQAYENALAQNPDDLDGAREAVYRSVRSVIHDALRVSGNRNIL